MKERKVKEKEKEEKGRNRERERERKGIILRMIKGHDMGTP